MEKLSNLPKPVLAGAAVGGGGSLIAAGVAIGSGNWWVFLIVACGCLIGVALWIERKRRD